VNITINGSEDAVETWHDDSEDLWVHVSIDEEGVSEPICEHCGGVEDDHDSAVDWECGCGAEVDSLDGACPNCGAGPPAETLQGCPGQDWSGTNTWEPVDPPLSWCKSAGVNTDPRDDAVTVSISVGDPRGGFTMTIRRLPDGRLVMYLPYPERSLLHLPLREIHPGTYEVG